eukprot:6491254-Amphidinium_carterae.2
MVWKHLPPEVSILEIDFSATQLIANMLVLIIMLNLLKVLFVIPLFIVPTFAQFQRKFELLLDGREDEDLVFHEGNACVAYGLWRLPRKLWRDLRNTVMDIESMLRSFSNRVSSSCSTCEILPFVVGSTILALDILVRTGVLLHTNLNGTEPFWSSQECVGALETTDIRWASHVLAWCIASLSEVTVST